MLIKRTQQRSEAAARGSLAGSACPSKPAVSTAAPSCAAPALPAALSPHSARCRSAASARRKQQRQVRSTSGATIRKSVCTHCSVGCTVTAEVLNGVWIGQEPSWDSPINRGSHCAKGASVRELVHSERRLRYPMKLVNGQWTRVSWDQAINEIGDKLIEIREKSGPRFGLLARLGQNDQRRRRICSASSARSGAPTTPTIRRASAIRRPSPAWPTPGATAR